ncbi:MAG: 50S ribosomal protein L22 [Candidatus Moranbacteria bacterium CG_4_10_14_3_um_filter_44_15]|nr:MAG: 50S ribosomal protein L22 [Candidatus Moranbacteria bacterium CG06_land_8_20_14_3_00_43_56]PIV84061.1 MAG: 50S ribosomal protein L22 [Candidatus Moranbacteria bacterium CG17_big_fil_post_rev_8_21_14_2_50_44_12]PIW93433.1 MAG: 50S ribosomal protein L22 [Candidatus Moranbacteria bacterium CG_4_8_14_3_um_filter_43_15]PIX90803.1 MAG: 50S ribosomal protein L22 [Candidatus Moranbacteria bacterium CG_4_10_14_3_um_filter_44_15]PJA86238.1 MAG: 50S ribosomal protein L22 [Candidatus Moranbacteria 
MQVSAKLNNFRKSTRKVRLVAKMLRGLEVKEAENQLKFLIKGSAPDFEKLLKSAIANAENNFGLDKDNLFVKDIIVNEGARLKRWLPRAYGRATLILKRTSNIEMVLAEKVEGKGRKKIEKRKEIKDIKHEEIERKEERGEEEAQEEKKEITKEKDEKEFLDEKKKSAGARGFLRRVFRRKSM